MTTRLPNIKIGDRIKFKAVCRWNTRSVWRKVKGFWKEKPIVRFAGCPDFVVRLSEITEHQSS